MTPIHRHVQKKKFWIIHHIQALDALQDASCCLHSAAVWCIIADAARNKKPTHTQKKREIYILSLFFFGSPLFFFYAGVRHRIVESASGCCCYEGLYSRKSREYIVGERERAAKYLNRCLAKPWLRPGAFVAVVVYEHALHAQPLSLLLMWIRRREREWGQHWNPRWQPHYYVRVGIFWESNYTMVLWTYLFFNFYIFA